MKKIILMMIVALMGTGSLHAQDETQTKKSKLGSFAKKVGEKTTGINMTDEPFIVNPLKAAVEIEFVGAYGDKTTGQVAIVFKAKNKTNNEKIGFGGSLEKTAAFDNNGKTYKPYASGTTRFDAPKDLWVEVVLKEKTKGAFMDVPETVESFELIKVHCYLDAKNRGLIEFRNIPIQWDATPE